MLELNIDLNPQIVNSLIKDAVDKLHDIEHPFRALTQTKKITPLLVMWETLRPEDQKQICDQVQFRLVAVVKNLIKNEIVTHLADQILGGGFRPTKQENSDY